MNVLDLFSGIGGFSLGLERAGMKTIAFCEKDKFCQKVLKKHWPDVPVFEDIAKLKGEMIHETIDLICGGFPCQPFSVAGKRKGKEDNRHLWPEMFRIIQETNPSWVIGENVAGIINLELEQVCTDLEGEGYEVQPFIIPACAVNAPHRRDRIWIIANAAGKRCYNRANNRQERYILRDKNWDAKKSKSERKRRKCGIGEINTDVANTRYIGQEKPEIETMGSEQLCINDSDSEETKCEQSGNAWTGGEGFTNNISWNENWIEVATRLCGMDARIPNRLDRLKSLGNSVVPQIVEIIGRKILSIK